MKKSGPPQCTCSICNEVVLKSTTKHIGDGKRACTKHEGVREKVDTLKTQEKNRLQSIINNVAKKERKPHTSWDFAPRCACCYTKGLPEHEINYQILMMWKLIEKITGEKVNPLNPSEEVKDTVRQACIKAYGYMPVALTTINAEKIPLNVKQRIIKDKMLRSFAPLLFICHDCMLKHNIYSYIDKPKIDMDIKNIMLLGSMMDDIMEKDVDNLIKEHLDVKE